MRVSKQRQKFYFWLNCPFQTFWTFWSWLSFKYKSVNLMQISQQKYIICTILRSQNLMVLLFSFFTGMMGSVMHYKWPAAHTLPVMWDELIFTLTCGNILWLLASKAPCTVLWWEWSHSHLLVIVSITVPQREDCMCNVSWPLRYSCIMKSFCGIVCKKPWGLRLNTLIQLGRSVSKRPALPAVVC